MSKRVILTLVNGSWAEGFQVILRIRDDAAPEVEEQFNGRLPSAPDIPELLRKWQEDFRERVKNSPTRAKARRKTQSSSSDSAQELKKQIEQWLRSPDEEWKKIREIILWKLQSFHEIRVIIQTEDLQLRQLPWSVWDLFVQRYKKAEIAFSSSEYEASGGNNSAGKVRILAVLGNSDSIDIEFDRKVLEKLPKGETKIEFLKQPSKQDLLKKLRDEQGWHIFFFAGHGESQEDGQIGWFEINQSECLEIEELKNALEGAIERGLQLAIFNSCDGLGLANQLARLHLPQSIVMREIVPDLVAQEFLQHFLTAFAGGESFYASVRQGRGQLEDAWDKEYPGVSWLPMICQNSTVVPPTWNKLRGRSSTRSRVDSWNKGTPGTQMSRQEFHNRLGVLADVKERVEGRLQQSLHHQIDALINLHKEAQPQQVKRPWDVEVKIGSMISMQLPQETEIIEVFDHEEVAGKLLILGAPGSGKTTTLLELARELIVRAEERPEKPIPVLFDLSAWKKDDRRKDAGKKDAGKKDASKEDAEDDNKDGYKDGRPPIKEWLVVQLKENYGVRKDIGKRWVENRELLPMLDGLDELEPVYQERCVEAINEFMQGECRPKCLVVCSRYEEYNLYETRLLLNGAICLQPLTDSQIQDYLAGLKQEELWQIIRNDAELLEMVRTPLLLGMIMVAGISIEEWQQLNDKDERLKYLLNAYVERMLRREIKNNVYGKKKVPSVEKTRFWLSWLAQQMERKYQTEFLIDRMQPSCLLNKNEKNNYNGMVTIIGLLIGSLIFCGVAVILEGWLGTMWSIMGVILGLRIGGDYKGLFTLLSLKKEQIELSENINLSWEIIKEEFNKKHKDHELLGISLWCSLMIMPTMLSLDQIINRTDDIMLVVIVLFCMGCNICIYEGTCVAISSLKGTKKTARKKTNQWIINEIKNAGIMCFFIASLMLIFMFAAKADVQLIKILGRSGLLVTSFLAIAVIDSFGFPGIKHFSLRLILFLNRYIPWNYARFLNYATERLFLQRVGGGYRFIHKLLQEHLAETESFCFNRSNELFESMDYKKAIYYYEKLLKMKSELPPDVQEKYAEAYYMQGQRCSDWEREKAIAFYDKALEIKSDFAQAWRERGAALFYLKRYEEAIASYEKMMVCESSNSKNYWYYRMFKCQSYKDAIDLDVLFDLKRYEEALASYDKVLEIESELPEVWLVRGDVLYDLKRYEEALASYDKALELKSDFPEVWLVRGDVLYDLKRYEEALTSYDKALELKSDFHNAWFNRGYVLFDLKRYEEALASYDKALELESDFHNAWFNRGYVLFDLKRYEEALASYDKALELESDSVGSWHNRGNALFNLKRYEEALASYDKALELESDSVGSWQNRGHALFNLKRYAEAIVSYEKMMYDKLLKCQSYKDAIALYENVVEIESDLPDVCYVRGNVLCDLKRYEEALTSYDKALELKSDFPKVWHNRGIVLIYLGRYEEGVASFDKALEIEPNSYNSFYNKSCCYALQANVPLAIYNLQEAINGNPDHYKEMAEADSDFDQICDTELFQTLIKGIEIKQRQSNITSEQLSDSNDIAELPEYEAYLYHGAEFLSQGEHWNALFSFSRCLQLKPDNYIVHYSKGWVLVNLGLYEEAIASYDLAIKLKRDYYWAWNERGVPLYYLGRYEEALNSFDRASEIRPNDAATFYNKACCYALQANVELAIDNLEEAIKINPAYKELAKNDSEFDSMRGDERFQELI